MTPSRPGKVIIISGPSGVGKSTVLKEIRHRFGNLRWSVSATTRPPRDGEQEGVDYHFLSPEEFERRRENNGFLEACEVFGRGYWYGTLRSEVEPVVDRGESVILELDVDGAAKVVEQYPQTITIFILPPSMEQLEARLRDRGSDSETAIERRLEVARREIEQSHFYKHRVVNRDVDETIGQISGILRQSNCVGEKAE